MNKEIRKFWIYLIWGIILVLVLIFHFVAAKNKMPYDDWLTNNLSVGLAVLNIIIICFSFLYFTIPRKQRSLKLTAIITSAMLALSIPLKISVKKAPLIVSVLTPVIMYISFFILRSYFKKEQNGKEKNGNGDGSN